MIELSCLRSRKEGRKRLGEEMDSWFCWVALLGFVCVSVCCEFVSMRLLS